MEKIDRLLKIALPKGRSAFLWGPRKTGKTTYLKTAFPNSLTFDMLQTDLFLDCQAALPAQGAAQGGKA